MITPIVIPCAYLLFDNFTNFIGRVLLRRPTPRMIDFDTEAPVYMHSHNDDHFNGDGSGTGSGEDSPSHVPLRK